MTRHGGVVETYVRNTLQYVSRRGKKSQEKNGCVRVEFSIFWIWCVRTSDDHVTSILHL